MIKVGTVQQIWRYPVKGMAGESLSECELGQMGLMGDRLWALRDTARQEIQSCKFRPQLLTCQGAYRDSVSGAVDITFPDGSVVGSDAPEIHRLLSALTGHQSTLESLRPGSEIDFYRRFKGEDNDWLEELKATFEREPGEPLPDLDALPQQTRDYVSVPGTFFLVKPFHLLTTATIHHLKQLNGKGDWDIARFRPNVVIETLPGMDGLVEQAWLDKQLQIGHAIIDCEGATPRCGAVVRQQQGLTTDKSILRTIVSEADQNLGIYASVAHDALIRQGDDVFLKLPDIS
ncbi:MAG: MOSC N-terminal beta barrel domain-containing protein [Methylophaga sp.]|nr:MOSC N-terminal beta barrel domain-containing protein [Methylophaga sp.]